MQSDISTARVRLNSVIAQAEASARQFERELRHATRDVEDAQQALEDHLGKFGCRGGCGVEMHEAKVSV